MADFTIEINCRIDFYQFPERKRPQCGKIDDVNKSFGPIVSEAKLGEYR